MKTKDEIYYDIDQVNKKKQNIIRMYFAAQASSDIQIKQKIENTKNIYFELRKLNDKITELECELVSSISFEV